MIIYILKITGYLRFQEKTLLFIYLLSNTT